MNCKLYKTTTKTKQPIAWMINPQLILDNHESHYGERITFKPGMLDIALRKMIT